MAEALTGRLEGAAAATPSERDDRVLPATRWASLVVFFILVPALVILWALPGETADLWAWTIRPELTPVFMGAGYGAGAYFFWRTYRARRWHPSAPGLFGAAFFAALMLLATLIHWDKFNHGDAPFLGAFSFYAWVAVYVVSPFAVLALWARNRRFDPRASEPAEPVVPRSVRLASAGFAAAALLAATVFYLRPATAIDVWPWQLTPLTARVLASFTAQVGIGALLLSRDARWSSWRLLIQTFFVATALLLVGAIRAFADFHGGVSTWVYLAGLVGTSLALLALYRRMERLGESSDGGL